MPPVVTASAGLHGVSTEVEQSPDMGFARQRAVKVDDEPRSPRTQSIRLRRNPSRPWSCRRHQAARGVQGPAPERHDLL